MHGSISTVDGAIIAAYLLGMVALGAMVSTRIRGFKDYFLAGGMLTTPLLVCTLVSTYYGLDVTFGTSESGFYYGLAAWVWYSCPYYLFILIAALVLAGRLKSYAFMTLPDLLEDRYGVGTRMVGAIACMVYSMPILAMAGMILLLELLGIPPVWGMVLTVGICAVYTILGGLWADAISDTVQFVLMCVSVAIVIPLALRRHGGFAFTGDLPAEFLRSGGGLSPWMLGAWAAAGLTVLVEPAFYQRIFAARDRRTVTHALVIGMALWIAYDWGVILIGMIARAAVERGQLGLDAGADGHKALLVVCMELLPTGLRGLFLGGILAAAMSTIDSYSLLAAGNLTYDIYRPLRRGRVSDRQLIFLTRVSVFVVMVLAALVSMLFVRLRDAWLFMASVLTAVVLVPVLGALFLRPRRAAGLAGAIGGLVGLVGFYVLLFSTGQFDEDEATYVLRLGPVELWQDCAALIALPVSTVAFTLGHLLGRGEP